MKQDGLPPLYEQVRRRILSEIEAGRLAEGSFLPPEPELCATYGVSRITLRRAVGELCDEGRLIRQQGRGTLVASRKMQQTISLSGFSDIVEGMGRKAGHVILGRDDQPEPPAAIGRIGIVRPIRFDRLLEVDGQPMTIETLWFDAARFPDAVGPVGAGGSFFAALLDRHGVAPAGAERLIDVGYADRREATILQIAAIQPVYRIEKVTLDREGLPLSLSRLVTPCHLVTLSLRT